MFTMAVACDQVKDNSAIESDILENLGQVRCSNVQIAYLCSYPGKENGKFCLTRVISNVG